IAVLGPRVQRKMTLGDHRDPRYAVRRELVHEHLDECHAACVRGVSQSAFSDLDGVQVRSTPELADRVAADSRLVHIHLHRGCPGAQSAEAGNAIQIAPSTRYQAPVACTRTTKLSRSVRSYNGRSAAATWQVCARGGCSSVG